MDEEVLSLARGYDARHPMAVEAKYHVAIDQMALGNYPKAAALLRECVEAGRSSMGRSPSLRAEEFALGRAEGALGNWSNCAVAC